LLCWAHARRYFYDARKTAPQLSYTADGDFSIDNNIAENLMRPIALGRKNWLFFGSDNGGRTAAILFTITQSAKRHGLNVFNYLKDIIARISDHPAKQLHQLLPDKWSPS